MKAHIASLLILFAAMNASGCLAIEKTSEVLVIPPDSKEVHLYEVLEGISVPDEENSTIKNAKSSLGDLKKPSIRFLTLGIGEKDSLLQYCRIEDARFFLDPERRRQLCMDRRGTILDREAFAKTFNKSISEFMTRIFKELDEKEMLADFEKQKEKLREESGGMLQGLGKLFIGLDLASLQKTKAAAEKGFRWVRFEPGIVRIMIPATPDCARRIVADRQFKDWLKQMRKVVQPIDLAAGDDGLAVVLGGNGQAIRLTNNGRERYRASDEKALIQHAGSPKAILIDGKAANGDRLIQQFIAEKMMKKQ